MTDGTEMIAIGTGSDGRFPTQFIDDGAGGIIERYLGDEWDAGLPADPS